MWTHAKSAVSSMSDIFLKAAFAEPATSFGSMRNLSKESGAHLWAGKFDGAIENIFDLQDRIVASVIGAIEPSLRGAEIDRARRKRPDDLNAYDLYLRALSHAYAYTPKGRTAALELLGKALEINPNYAEAHGVAAQCYMQRVWTALDLSADLASALAHTRAIMSIKTDDASTLAFAAGAYARGTRDYETAIQMIEHALAHNPSSAAAQSVGAVVNSWAGHYETAVTLAERSLRFSLFEPTRHLALAALSRSRLFQGNPKPRSWPRVARCRLLPDTCLRMDMWSFASLGWDACKSATQRSNDCWRVFQAFA